MIDITKGMSQEELVKQCLFVVSFPDKNINVQELQQMEMKIKYPRNKYGVIDLKSELYIKMEIVRDKIRQLLFYYN